MKKSLGLDEMIFRTREEFWTLLERWRVQSHHGWPSEAEFFSALNYRISGLEEIRIAALRHDFSKAKANFLDYFIKRSEPHFFFDPNDLKKLLAEILTRRPEASSSAVTRGKKILSGKIRLLGIPEISFTRPINWLQDPLEHRIWPFQFWPEICVLGDDRPDPKWVWELNRHAHWMDLCRACLISQDDQLAQEMFYELETWILQNPPEMGINWASSLEIAMRSLAWFWVLFFMLNSPEMTPDRLFLLVRGLWRNGCHLERHLSVYSSPNTHLIGEAVGLFFIGLLLPELKESRKWLHLGKHLLKLELAHQIRPDGAHVEQSAHYHRYTVDFYLQVLLLARKNHLDFLEDEIPRFNLMIDYLQSVTQPDGSLLRTGDDDGGRVIFLGEEPVWDAGSTLALGAVALNRNDLKRSLKELPEETCWLLGRDEIPKWDSLESSSESSESKGFSSAGLYVMEENKNSVSSRIYFRCGPQGLLRAGHGHADALSIQWFIGNRPVLIDPGTYSYGENPIWRDYFRGTSAHNTLCVDKQDQADPSGRFSWNNPVTARCERWNQAAKWDWATGSHSGYERLSDPVMHHRDLLFFKNNYALVIDRLTAENRHSIEYHLHFGPGEVQLNAKQGLIQWSHLDSSGGTLMVVNPAQLDLKLLKGSENPLGGWYSPAYGIRIPSMEVCGCYEGSLPFTQILLLIPELENIPVRIETISSKNEERILSPLEMTALKIHWKNYWDYVAVSHRGVGKFSLESLQFCGEMVFLRISRMGSPIFLNVGNAQEVSWDGKSIWKAKESLFSGFFGFENRTDSCIKLLS